jgi:hypothetical protein
MKRAALIACVLICAVIVPAVLAEPVLEINFDITDNITVSGFSASVIDGRPSLVSQGSCMVMIQGADRNTLWTSGYDLAFQAFDAETPVTKMHYTDKIPYSGNMKTVDVIYNGIPVFSAELNLCNDDGSCGQNENYLSCPADCPLDKKDSLCIAKPDSVCDPDCLEGYDPDCIKPRSNCGDGFCGVADDENFASCAIDCSGASDGICDKQNDAVCDPDCAERDDTDCRTKEDENPFVIPVVAVLIICIIAVAVFMSYRRTRMQQAEQIIMEGRRYDS